MLVSRCLRTVVTLTVVACLLLVSQSIAEAAVDCFMCHDRDAFQKRVKHEPAASGDCLSCHSPHVARFGGLLQQQVKDLCYSCHTDAAETQNQGIVHKPVQQGECLGCHNPHSSDQNGLMKARLSETCFACHTELPRKYKNTHSPYAKGECTSCHQPHQSLNANLLVKEPESLCLGCHSLASVQKKHPNFPAKLGQCGSCHNPHGSDRPALVRDILHEPYADDCGNCHAGKNAPVPIDTCLGCHPEVSEQMASSHNHLVRFEDNGCMACHSPHAGDDKRLLKGRQRHVCGKCHEATFQRLDSAKFSHTMKGACNDCHAPHGSNHPAMTKATITEVCSECHGQHGVFTHPIGENVFDPRTGQNLTCISCHATKGTDYPYHTRLSGTKDLCVQCHAEY